MKRLLTITSLFACLLWTATTDSAQHRAFDGHCRQFAQTHLRLGGSLHGLGSVNSPRMGATIGLIHEWHFFPFLQLRGEANVVWQGAEGHFWRRDDVDYISANAPLMLQIGLSRGWYFAGGVGVSYLIHAEGGSLPSERFGLDWVGVLSYRFRHSRVGFELRYMHRMGSQPNAALDPTTNLQPFNPSSAQAAFTFRF